MRFQDLGLGDGLGEGFQGTPNSWSSFSRNVGRISTTFLLSSFSKFHFSHICPLYFSAIRREASSILNPRVERECRRKIDKVLLETLKAALIFLDRWWLESGGSSYETFQPPMVVDLNP